MIDHHTSSWRLGTHLLIGIAILLWAQAGVAESTALARALEGYVRSHAPHAPTAVELPSLADFAAADLDGVDVELSTSPREDFLGRVPVTVAIRDDRQELKRGVVTVRVRAERPVLVAARSLRRGERLRRSDLRLERRDLAEIGDGWLTDTAAATGQRTRRSLAAGTTLRTAWLEDPPRVSRGDRVRLRFTHGTLRIDGLGQARADGREGDRIPVLNIDSKRELLGRVDAEGVVHVDF